MQDEAATRIQQFYRKHRSDLSLRRRSFSKFGQEAFDLIKRYASRPCRAAKPCCQTNQLSGKEESVHLLHPMHDVCSWQHGGRLCGA